MQRVVITGIGMATPLGLDAATTWSRFSAGESGLKPIEAFDASSFDTKIGGELPDFKITQHVPKSYRKATKLMARDIQIAVLCAEDAFANSGLTTRADDDGPSFDPARFGCNIGAGLISAELDELGRAMHEARGDDGKIDWKRWGDQGMSQLTPLWLLKYLPNMLASHVTIIHGLTGPSNNITCAEASGHLSVGEATRAIRRGVCDLAIAGGCESLIDPTAMMRQQLLGRLSKTGTVRPFADDADGCVCSEGGALLILEDLEHAEARNATIYAEVAGFGSTQDPFDTALPDPDGSAYTAAIRSAMRQAKVDKVDLVVPHGLGVPHHDRSEMRALRAVFGETVPELRTTKQSIGTSAAGCVIDLALAAMMVKEQETTVLSSIFGLGGQNGAIVLKHHGSSTTPPTVATQ